MKYYFTLLTNVISKIVWIWDSCNEWQCWWGNEGAGHLRHINEFQLTQLKIFQSYPKFAPHIIFVILISNFRDFNNGQFINSGANSHINDVSRYKLFIPISSEVGVTFQTELCSNILYFVRGLQQTRKSLNFWEFSELVVWSRPKCGELINISLFGKLFTVINFNQKMTFIFVIHPAITVQCFGSIMYPLK